MTQLKILICGSGIAGPVLVYWLARLKQDFSITVVERSPVPRTTGQAIDIRGNGVELIRKMGLEEEIRKMNTTEKGLYFVDSNGKHKGVFPATGSSEVQGFTSEYEIQRSDLSKVCLDAVKDEAEWVFGEYVSRIDQSQEDATGKVHVNYMNGRPSESFDLVIGADGLTSKTRKLVFGSDPQDSDYTRQLGQFSVLFTIPPLETSDGWARWYNMNGGKLLFIRPDRHGNTAVYLGITQPDLTRFDKAAEDGHDELKRILRQEFHDQGFVINKVLDELDQVSDLYYSRVAQVKMQEFVRGHVALLGDAGYCPSPISGQGTTAALIGAYVLAGEISESLSDIPTALRRYQDIMKPKVAEFQKLAPGAPRIANPQTRTGISILRGVTSVLSISFIRKCLFERVGSNDRETWRPPSYTRLAAA